MTEYKPKSVEILKNNINPKRIYIGILVFFLVCVIFLGMTPWQQTTFCHGKVIAYSPSERQQDITALFDGRIDKWYVDEGSVVKKGDKIAEIVDNDPHIFKNLNAEKNSFLEKKRALENALSISRINMDRQKNLYDEGLSARKTYESAQIEFSRIQSEISGIDVSIAQINTRLSRQDAQTVKAPISGTIIRRIAGDGSVLVKSGQNIATLVPETSSRAIALIVNPNDLPLIHQGQKVRLQFEGWPAVQFSGWPSVAVGTFGGVVDFVDTAADANGHFRVLVIKDPSEKWPDPQYIRQGVKVNAWILLGKVKLGYEIWRQFNGFPASIQKENEK